LKDWLGGGTKERDMARSNRELEQECTRLFQLAKARLIGWEGAVAIQETLEKRLTALLSAIAAYANAADDTAEAQAQAALFKLAREIEDPLTNPPEL